MSIHCDFCNEKMEFQTIDLSFGYGSLLDCNSFVFCTDKCLKDFVLKEVNIIKDASSTQDAPKIAFIGKEPEKRSHEEIRGILDKDYGEKHGK